MRAYGRSVWVLGLWLTMSVAFGTACGDDDDQPGTDAMVGDGDAGDGDAGDGDSAGGVLLTDERTLVPVMERMDPADERDPRVPEERMDMLADGLGEWEEGPGEKHVVYPKGEDAPERGSDARMLARFVHLADLQLVDDESPGRAVNFDGPSAFGGAFRPQESYLCHMTNAMVKTLNAVHEDLPIDFVLLGGDNADNAQENEHTWVLQILGGADEVECDSADNTELVDGPDNDGKDPFEAPGLDMPYYWVTGNHDILVQGTAPITDEFQMVVVSDSPEPGYQLRDFSMPGGPIGTGPVPKDADRRFLSRTELMTKVFEDGDGHGLSMREMTSGKAIYTFDVKGTDLRFLVLDTAAETGASDGVIHQADIDMYIEPALEQAVEDDKFVVLASHHATRAMTDGGGFMGMEQADAVSAEDWIAFLGDYPNVVFSLVAHDHSDAVEWLGPKDERGFWELTTSAMADYPHQARVMEIWDEDNGYLSLKTTYVDIDMRDEPIAKTGREIGVMDYISGYNVFFSDGIITKRNAHVFIEKP